MGYTDIYVITASQGLKNTQPVAVKPPEPKKQSTPAASPRRPATKVEPRETRLEDFGSDYPTPPPEASGEDF